MIDFSKRLFVTNVICCVSVTFYTLRDTPEGYYFESNRWEVIHLLFTDDLKLYASHKMSLESFIQAVRVFSYDMGREFELEKCAVLTMKKGKMANKDGIALLNKTTMKGLKQGDSYKYFVVKLADKTKHHEMKERQKTNEGKSKQSTIDWEIY